MDFLQRHLFFIVCGVGAVAGIALGLTGLRAMPQVLEEMHKAESLYRNLDGLQSRPVNKARIDAESERIDKLKKDRDKVFAQAGELYQYDPLVADVLPEGIPLKRIDFREEYARAMEKLLASLDYGDPAGADEVAMWREKIEDEMALEKETGLDRGAAEPAPQSKGPPRTPAGVLTRTGALEDPVARAHMAAAQRIYCYAVRFDDERPPNRIASLEFDPIMMGAGTADAPELDDVWRAQVGYWIQKDVVDAIVTINTEAAERARSDGEDPWVGIMPVKEVISIRVAPEFVPPEGEGELYAVAEPGGYEAALPPGTAQSVFTGTGSAQFFEVVQYTVKLIMGQRDIPRLIDRLSKNSLHTLLRVSYEAVSPNRNMVGKIYGSEPTVNVVMDFETIMLGEVFRRLMPCSVRDYYEIPCRDFDDFDECVDCCVDCEDEG